MRVAIIGGGIAGAEVVRNMLPGRLQITLIEPKRQIECQALYPEYLAGVATLDDLTAPLKPFCDRAGAELVTEHAIGIQDGMVLCDRSQIEYDMAVVATGAAQNYFGISGADRAFSVNTLKGAIRARDFLEHERPDKITIIGAGLTGIEIACNLSDSTDASIYLVETKARVMPQFSENASRQVERFLSEKGIRTLVSTKVQEIKGDSIELLDGKSIESDMTIWTAGIKPCSFVQGLSLPKWNDEWVLTDPCLRASDDIFVIGDNAWLDIDGKVASKTAVEAERQAGHMAENLVRLAEGKKLKRYSIAASTDSQIALISIGRDCAVGVYGDRCITIPTKIIHALKFWVDRSFVQRFK